MGKTWEWKSDDGGELIVEYRPGGTLTVIAKTDRGVLRGPWLDDGTDTDQVGEVVAELVGMPYEVLKDLMSAMAGFRRQDVRVSPPTLTATTRIVLKEMRRVDPEPVYPSGVCRDLSMPVGSISLAVRQLVQRGLIVGRWETEAEKGVAKRPFRKYYELTDAGRVYK